MNKVILVGNVGKSPEQTAVGEKVVTRFSMAVSRTYKNKDGVYPVDWINVDAWSKTGDYCAKFKKGDKVCVCGSLQCQQYEKDGVKKTYYVVNAESVENCTPKNSAEKNESNDGEGYYAEMDDSALPF